MPLRTKLLLSLSLLALVPLALFGFMAYRAATDSLIVIERDNLDGALNNANLAFAAISDSCHHHAR